jgi:hypothetical protein
MLGRDAARLRELADVVPDYAVAGMQRRAIEAGVIAGLRIMGAELPAWVRDDGATPADERGSLLAALELADRAGLLMWRALIGLALGTLARGRFPEAAPAVDEAEAFFRERGMGHVLDTFRASQPDGAASAETRQPVPGDEVHSER